MSEFHAFEVTARTPLDDGTYEYALAQVAPDFGSAGGYVEAVPSLEVTAYEANNALVEVGSVVAARFKHTSGGHPVYEFFDGAGSARVVVKVTSATVDADGNYPDLTTRWDTADEVWADGETVVKLKAANGETLVSGNRYLAVPAGPNAADETVYVMDGGVSAAGSLVLMRTTAKVNASSSPGDPEYGYWFATRSSDLATVVVQGANYYGNPTVWKSDLQADIVLLAQASGTLTYSATTYTAYTADYHFPGVTCVNETDNTPTYSTVETEVLSIICETGCGVRWVAGPGSRNVLLDTYGADYNATAMGGVLGGSSGVVTSNSQTWRGLKEFGEGVEVYGYNGGGSGDVKSIAFTCYANAAGADFDRSYVGHLWHYREASVTADPYSDIAEWQLSGNDDPTNSYVRVTQRLDFYEPDYANATLILDGRKDGDYGLDVYIRNTAGSLVQGYTGPGFVSGLAVSAITAYTDSDAQAAVGYASGSGVQTNASRSWMGL